MSISPNHPLRLLNPFTSVSVAYRDTMSADAPAAIKLAIKRDLEAKLGCEALKCAEIATVDDPEVGGMKTTAKVVIMSCARYEALKRELDGFVAKAIRDREDLAREMRTLAKRREYWFTESEDAIIRMERAEEELAECEEALDEAKEKIEELEKQLKERGQ